MDDNDQSGFPGACCPGGKGALRQSLCLLAVTAGLVTRFACAAVVNDAIPRSLPVEFTRPESPFIMVTRQQIPHLRDRVKNLPWARECAAGILKQAEEILKAPTPFPDKEAGWGHRFACRKCGSFLKYDRNSPARHHCEKCNEWYEGEPLNAGWRWCSMVGQTPREQQTLAAAYLITGDNRFANALAASFRDVAAKYSRLRLHDSSMNYDPERVKGKWAGGRANSQSIDECSMLTAMLPSYDALLGSGVLSKEDQAFIEKNLWALALEYLHLLAGKRHSGGNWDIWTNSAMVMLGIAFNDPKLVDEGINSPKFGLLHCVRLGYLNPDGCAGENSLGYHYYIVNALFRMFAATRPAGISIDQLPLFQRMIELPALAQLPEGVLPVLNDSRKLTIEPNLHEVAWNWYRKPEHAQLLAAYYATRPGRNQSLEALLYGPGELPAVAPVTESSFLPNTMLAVLRTPHSDWHALLKCDKGLGAGHRHPDAMNLHLWANGEEAIPGTGAPLYGDPIYTSWFQQTISHSTITLNTRSQSQTNPARKERLELALAKWGCSATEMSIEGIQSDPSEHPARLRRLIAMTPHGLVDIFRVESAMAAANPPPGTHRVNLLDWALQLEGTLSLKQRMAPWDTPLIAKERLDTGYDAKTKKYPHAGYRWLTEIRKVTEAGPIHGRLAQPKGGVLELWLATGPTPTEVFVAKSPGSAGSINQPHTTLLQRRAASDTVFAGFYAPHKGEPQVNGVQFEKISSDGAEVAMTIAHKDGADLILSRAREGVLEAAGAKLNGVFGCGVMLPGGARQVMLVGKQWQQADVQIRLDETRAIIVDLQSGKIRLYNASATAAKGVMQTGGNGAAKPFVAPAGQSIDL